MYVMCVCQLIYYEFNGCWPPSTISYLCSCTILRTFKYNCLFVFFLFCTRTEINFIDFVTIWSILYEWVEQKVSFTLPLWWYSCWIAPLPNAMKGHKIWESNIDCLWERSVFLHLIDLFKQNKVNQNEFTDFFECSPSATCISKAVNNCWLLCIRQKNE